MELHKWGQRAPTLLEKFSPECQTALDTVLTWTVFHQPFFAHMLMAELPCVATKDVPIAATDAFRIFLNPDTFFKYPIPEQAFIICHEVMHCVFSDPQLMHKWFTQDKVTIGSRELPIDTDLMNCAMDFVINAQLKAGRVGQMPSCALYDPMLSEYGNEAAVDVYEKLLKRGNGGRGMGGQDIGSGSPGKGFDFLVQPGAGTGKPADDVIAGRDEMVWKQAIASAAQAAEMQGKLPASLRRLIGEILEPKVPWQDHIRGELCRIAGSEGLDWSQANRRMICRDFLGYDPIFFARESGFAMGPIVVGADSSGSIQDPQTTAFFREMHGMFSDLNPSQLIIMDCDAKVHRVRYVEELSDLDDIVTQGVMGGGGTRFEPVFEEVDALGIEPDVLIYLTDMDGSFPREEPSYPVIWASISKGRTAPFGKLVEVEL